MKKTFLFLVTLLVGVSSFAQYTEQDSLKLQELFVQVSKTNPDSIASISHKIIKKIKEPRGKTFGYRVLAYYHLKSSNHDSTIFYSEKIINILKEEKAIVYQNLSASTYKRMGDAYRNKGLPDKALFYYLNGIEIAEKIDDEAHIATNKTGVANVYVEKEEYDKAAVIFEEIIKNSTDEDDQLIYGSYINLAMLEGARGNKEKSLENYTKALAACRRVGDYNCISTILNNLGTAYTNTEKKISSYKEAIRISKKHGYDRLLLMATYNLGVLYSDIKQYDKALEYFESSFFMVQQEENHFMEQHIYDELFMLHEERGNYKKANEYLKKRNQIVRRIDSLQQGNDYNDLRVKYETSEKEKEVLALREEQLINTTRIEKQNTIKWSIIIGFGVLLIPIAFLLNTYYQRMHTQRKLNDKLIEVNQQKIAGLIKDQELKLVRASLDGKDQERKRIAQKLHDSVGGNLSSIKLQLDNIQNGKSSYEKVVHQIDETYHLVREISHNLIPRKFSQNPFTSLIKEYLMNVQSSNDLSIIFNPYPEEIINQIDQDLQVELFNTIQELLTNVLKHAKASQVAIQLDHLDEEITLIFEDDGVGFDINKTSTGIGLEIIRSRLHGLGGKLIIDSKPGRGTAINIDILVSKKS